MSDVQVIQGNCQDVLKTFTDNSIDAVVTDPPYDLTSGKGGTKGFMGHSWDATGIAFNPAVWVECLRVLKPGGHLLAFGGTRTWHRLAVAVEDAGFEIRDSIAWLYGSGLPKSRKLDGEWEGWGTSLKPGHEPIVMARKPLIGPAAENVAAHGTGLLNIDGCRIGEGADKTPAPTRRGDSVVWLGSAVTTKENLGGDDSKGRWPANAILDVDAAEALDHQSGVRKYGGKASDYQQVGSGGASRFFYCTKAPKRERPEVNGITHPTVKPVTLMRWLVRLVTPPRGVVLDPFAGSGATLEAALLEGFHAVGIERESIYVPLIDARLTKAGLNRSCVQEKKETPSE